MSILGPGHCDTCQWWGGERAHDDDHPFGRCRATPPSLEKPITLPGKANDIEVTRGLWKWTAFDDWCAAYMDKTRTQGL